MRLLDPEAVMRQDYGSQEELPDHKGRPSTCIATPQCLGVGVGWVFVHLLNFEEVKEEVQGAGPETAPCLT